MARIAKGRDRVLTREEIATETLRQFDQRPEAPSIRALASALGVAPSAIYHHYESQAAIVQAATELVWEESTRNFLAVIPDPYNADPVEVLVTAGIVTRRAFCRHFRIAPFLAASPETTEFMAELLGMLAGAFGRLGLRGEDAGVSFHTYASFTIGSVLFAATRRVANEKLGSAGKRALKSSGRPSFDDAFEIAATDPARDEDLFAAGLGRLIASFPSADGGAVP